MRATIESVATCADPRLGSRALAILAARRALEAAGRCPDTVELLVNAGVYRDENIIEPAMAPFVQKGIGANPAFPPLNGTRTFSFDLSNGACGVLTAIRVIDGFMRSGAVRSGLVVASDVDPDPRRSDSYAFPAAGGAVLLRAGSEGEGFAWFHARTWSEHFPLYEACLRGTDDAASEGAGGRAATQRIRIRERAGLLECCLDCACEAVEELVRRGDLDRDGIDLLIVSRSIPGFVEAIAARLGLEKSAARWSGDFASPLHTASTAFAVEAALRDGSWARAKRILFLAVSAGITVSLALYERDPA